jgi:hypothetical protein
MVDAATGKSETYRASEGIVTPTAALDFKTAAYVNIGTTARDLPGRFSRDSGVESLTIVDYEGYSCAPAGKS